MSRWYDHGSTLQSRQLASSDVKIAFTVPPSSLLANNQFLRPTASRRSASSLIFICEWANDRHREIARGRRAGCERSECRPRSACRRARSAPLVTPREERIDDRACGRERLSRIFSFLLARRVGERARDHRRRSIASKRRSRTSCSTSTGTSTRVPVARTISIGSRRMADVISTNVSGDTDVVFALLPRRCVDPSFQLHQRSADAHAEPAREVRRRGSTPTPSRYTPDPDLPARSFHKPRSYAIRRPISGTRLVERIQRPCRGRDRDCDRRISHRGTRGL
jgi:hypothetical protein